MLQPHKHVSIDMQAVNNFNDGKGNFQFFTIKKNSEEENEEGIYLQSRGEVFIKVLIINSN